MPWCDEAWFASSAVNLVRNGFMGNTILNDAAWPGLSQYTFWQPPLYFLFEALIFKLFGIGLFQVRFINVFWGIIGMVAIYFSAKELFVNYRKLIIILLILIGTDIHYLRAASDGRMDMMSAALSFISFAIFLKLRKKNLYWAIFLSNIFVCLSGLTHPNGLLGLLVLIFLIIYLDRKKINLKIVFIAFIPYIFGALLWGAYIVKDIDAFKMQFFGNVIREKTLKWEAISHELVERYLKSYGFFSDDIRAYSKIPILVFFFFGIAVAPFIVRHKTFKLIWIMLFICFLGMMFIVGNKTSCYLVWITPLFLMNSIALWQELKRNRFVNIFFSMSFIYIFLISVVASGFFIKRNNLRNLYLSDLNKFSSEYYSGGNIFGSGEIGFYFNFNDDIVQDDVRLGYFTRIKPKYFIVCNRYRRWFERFKENDHELYIYIMRTLANEYIKIFKGKFYTFYERKS